MAMARLSGLLCLLWATSLVAPRTLRAWAGSGSLAASVREALTPESLAQWRTSARALAKACEVQEEEAEVMIAKAFGWSTWLAVNKAAYLRPQEPDAQQISEAIEYLTEGPLRLKLGSSLGALLAQEP